MWKILRINRSVSFIARRFSTAEDFVSNDVSRNINERLMENYMKYLNLSNKDANEFIKINPEITGGHLNPDEIEATLKYLTKTKGYTPFQIIDRPTCVLFSPLTYQNREKVFHECAFRDIQLLFYIKFVSLMNKKVTILKAHNYIHPKTNVQQNLIKQLDVPIKVKPLPDSTPLFIMRQDVMNEYFKTKLGMTDNEIAYSRTIYTRLKHRNLSSIVEVIELLKNELNFSNARIIKNAFLIHSFADNIRSIITEIPKIGNSDIKDILRDRPKIMMQPCSSLTATIKHIKSFNIKEESIERCLEVLTLGADTVYNRLAELHAIKDFQVHFTNPRILRLIHYKNKVRSRLDYLKSLKIRCYSIHLLSASNEAFEKFAYDGLDKTKGVDSLEFLSHTFDVDPIEVRSILRLHPSWLQAPIIEIKNTYDYLRGLNYTKDEIYQNLVILLYPISRIEPKLSEMIEWKEENDESRKISDVEVRKISNTKLLSLCVYFIESEYHFTGDGVFEVQKFDRNQEPVLITALPKTSNYRYGVKPKSALKAQVSLE